MLYIFRTPPGFCADAVSPPEIATSNALAAMARRLSLISLSPIAPLFVEPDVFHAPVPSDDQKKTADELILGPIGVF